MTRARLAAAATRLVSGGNRLTTGVTALCLTGIVLLAGTGLASAAHGVRSQLFSSEILARLIHGEPSNPLQTASFLRYLNAMAPAVLNLEIPPEDQVEAFETLYSLSEKWEVTLRAFSFEEGRLDVNCSTEDSAFARRFYDEVKASGRFFTVTISDLASSGDFIIHCDFKT